MLPNRVTPHGEIVATPHRGAWMGNRGGRLHRPDRTLGARRWITKSWITCHTSFRARRREVMGAGYTELFFLDEATALAAGHRPCFECRRGAARAFAEAWARACGLDAPPRAGEIDAQLHSERLDRAVRPGRSKKVVSARLETLPAGCMVAFWGETWLVGDTHLFQWSHAGYQAALARFDAEVDLLTPPSVVAVLAAGYRVETAAPF